MGRIARSAIVVVKPKPEFKAPAEPKPCDCCVAARSIATAALFAAMAVGALLLLSELPHGHDAANASGGYHLDRLRPVLQWPLLIWIGLLVFAALGQSLRCLKLAPDKLYEIFFGKKPEGGPSTAGIPTSTITRIQDIVTAPVVVAGGAAASIAAAAAVAITLDFKPGPIAPIPLTLNVDTMPQQLHQTIRMKLDVEQPPVINTKVKAKVDFDTSSLKLPIYDQRAVYQAINLLAQVVKEEHQVVNAALAVGNENTEQLRRLVEKLAQSTTVLAAESRTAAARMEQLNHQTVSVIEATFNHQLDTRFMNAFTVHTTLTDTAPVLLSHQAKCSPTDLPDSNDLTSNVGGDVGAPGAATQYCVLRKKAKPAEQQQAATAARR